MLSFFTSQQQEPGKGAMLAVWGCRSLVAHPPAPLPEPAALAAGWARTSGRCRAEAQPPCLMEVLVFGHRRYFPGSLTGTTQFVSVLPTPAVSAPGAGRFEHRVGQSTACTCVPVPNRSTGPS